jgi:hypothetical protein
MRRQARAEANGRVTTTRKVAYMQELLHFAVQLSVIAWLRSVGGAPCRFTRRDRLRMELAFGLLIALPLLCWH